MNTKSILLPFSLLALSAAVSGAYAHQTINNDETEIKELAPVLVTVSRSSREAEKIPGAITIITNEEIQNQLTISNDIATVIGNLVPSMTPSRQKLSNQGENMRGRNALFLVDGVPQNNPLRNSNRYGYTIDPMMLERVDVMAGANATQGMGATGGVINYVTKSAKPGDHWKNTVGTRMSSAFRDDSLSTKVYYNLSHHTERYDFFVGGTWDNQGVYYDGNGKQVGMNSIQGETQDSTAHDLYFKGGFNFGANLEQRIELTANNYELESDNDYIPVPGDFNKGIPGTLAKGHNPGEPVSNKVKLGNLTYTHSDLFGGSLKAQVFTQSYDAVFGDASWGATATVDRDQGVVSSDKSGFKVSYEMFDLFGMDDVWVFGIDGLSDETGQSLRKTGLDVTPTMKYESISPFIQGDFMIVDGLRLSVGARYEDIRIKSEDSVTLHGYGTRDVVGGENAYDEFVFNVGAIYSLTENLNIFAAYSQGFGLPDYGRILRGNWGDGPGKAPIYFEGLSDVEPVVTDNYELGFNYTSQKFDASATAYISLADDGANLRLISGTNAYTVDRQKTQIWGYELSAAYRPLTSTELRAMFSHIESRIDTDGDDHTDADADLKNVSPDRLMLSVQHRFNDDLSAYLQYNHYFDLDNDRVDQHFDGYGVFDLVGNYNLGRYGRVTFGIENLLDEQYIGYFSQVRKHKDYYFSGRGRTFSVGYEFNF